MVGHEDGSELVSEEHGEDGKVDKRGLFLRTRPTTTARGAGAGDLSEARRLWWPARRRRGEERRVSGVEVMVARR